MIRWRSTFLLLLASGLVFAIASLSGQYAEETDRPDSDARKFAARSRAYDLEFAVSAGGNYKRRDTYWEGVIGEEDIVLMPLQLIKGNDYIVALGLGAKENAVAVTAFDCAGKVMPLISDEKEGCLLLQIQPDRSGTHFLRLRLRKGATAPVFGVMTYLYR